MPDDGELSMSGEVHEGTQSTPGKAHEDALSMLGEGIPSEEGGAATSTSECLIVGKGLGMIGDEVDDQFSSL